MISKMGRSMCGVLPAGAQGEWLVTNGLGSYASGTIAGILTRRYHGLLVAALRPPLARHLLVPKCDETVAYDGQHYPLYANRWASGVVDPLGFHFLESFRLEGAIPVWRYALADALLEKRVWMGQGTQTTYIRYSVVRARAPLSLSAKIFTTFRDFHQLRRAGGSVAGERVLGGVRVAHDDSGPPLFVIADPAGEVELSNDWYYGFYLTEEEARGLDYIEDSFHAATFRAELSHRASYTIALTIEPDTVLDGDTALEKRLAYERDLLKLWRRAAGKGSEKAPGWIGQLALAADQFIVERPTPRGDAGTSIIAGYPWFSDWGRDTMIALPGLTLTTGRPRVARALLKTYCEMLSGGLLPNCFPDHGEEPFYNSVDAALWLFESLRQYVQRTGDARLLRETFPVLEQAIEAYLNGTKFGILVDRSDGLLYAGESGVQLTWMDAKVGDWVVTARTGKPVEINALWYNALRTMSHFAKTLGQEALKYDQLAKRCKSGFARFWNERLNYCYDVLDGPYGADSSLRPNQIFAVGLPETPLTATQCRSVVDVCSGSLLTSFGLRTLAPGEHMYRPHYEGDARERDASYHQGTVWPWLIGPFISAHLRVYRSTRQARQFLEPFEQLLTVGAVGSVNEILDGDPPHTARGAVAQAWSVAELLRAWELTEEKERKPLTKKSVSRR